jgi:ligand-binding SRPBCC domain-containing protein
VAAPHRLQRAQLIPRPLDEIFAFFADAGNLETVTPPTLGMALLTPRPISMHAGTLIDYQLRLFGIRFRWQTRIETFEPLVRFTDVQRRGPYRRWHHLHEFFATTDGTLVVDTVDYELPLGPLGTLAHTLFVRRTLELIFDYRRTHLTERFGGAAAPVRRSA